MQSVSWKVETWEIAKLKENPNNPRRINKKQAHDLEESLKKFGLCQPIVINQEGEILGGHQRVRILKKRGVESVTVCIPTTALTSKEEKELSIRLNKSGGEWDSDILANNFDYDDLIGCGFEPEELGIFEEAEEKVKEKKITCSVKSQDEKELSKIKAEIEEILSSYLGITYSLKLS